MKILSDSQGSCEYYSKSCQDKQNIVILYNLYRITYILFDHSSDCMSLSVWIILYDLYMKPAKKLIVDSLK